ncbi:MAG: hypothetical protein ACI4DK_07680 [Lachnospiraceae bacterium]
MHKDFVPPISIEEFAAYLDGNLSAAEMNRVANLVNNNSDMEEIVSISDAVDEDMQIYMQDEFAYEADMSALESSDYDIPNLDADISTRLDNDSLGCREDICEVASADEITGAAETTPFNNDKEIEEEMIEHNDLLPHLNEGSGLPCFEDGKNDFSETSDFPCIDIFFD